MIEKPFDLGSMFKDATFHLQPPPEERRWHGECRNAYMLSVREWVDAHRGNGNGGQHIFTVYAGTGAGKTECGGHLAAFLLNGRLADQVVVVCPNRSIKRRTREVFRKRFKIDLVLFHARKHAEGVGRAKQGYILTYGHLIQDPALHRRICSPETLVIFDEIHHLGDRNGWGEAALDAFGGVKFVVALTGTPYRSDNTRIPFVGYEADDDEGIARFVARPPFGFAYNLGEAVAEGICRKPLFRFHKATVRIRSRVDGGELEVTFDDHSVSDSVAADRLRGAVHFTSPARRELLRAALDECRAEGRKVIIFLGGDTEGEHTPTMDATEFMPAQLRELGLRDDEFVVVTGDDKDAQEKIAAFDASPAWVLVSINLVSEGTDVPSVSAAIFLTTITAKQTTIQRIGRALRLRGPEDPHVEALIFMFADRALMDVADKIEAEIVAEVNLRRKRDAQSGEKEAGSSPRRAEVVCVGGGEASCVMFNGLTIPAERVESARGRLRALKLPSTMLNAVLFLMMDHDHGHA